MNQATDLRQKIHQMHMLPAERATALQNLAAAEALADALFVIAGWFHRRPSARAKQPLKAPLGAH